MALLLSILNQYVWKTFHKGPQSSTKKLRAFLMTFASIYFDQKGAKKLGVQQDTLLFSLGEINPDEDACPATL
jgi:hypothetical protein